MADESTGVIVVPCAATSTVAQFVALVDGLAHSLSNEKKKASDGLDAYTLLDRLDAGGALATAVAAAPWDIPALTEAYLRRGFLANADVTAGRINRWMSLPEPIAPDDLRRVATRFLSQFV